MLKSLQFELWEDCNSMCKFCYLDQFRKTTDDAKIESLKKTYEHIMRDDIYEKYNVLSYIGGEFFQGQLDNPEVKDWFFKIMKRTAELSDSGILEQVWITATMNIGDQHDMYEMLKLFRDKSRVWICTSYDTCGRFHTQKMHDTWEYHMAKLKSLYPDIQLNTTIILTGDLVKKYVSGEFSVKEFMNKYDTILFLKTPGVPCEAECTIAEKLALNEKFGFEFFPKRSDFLNFLVKFKQEEGDYMYDRLYNISLRADDLYKNTNDSRQLNNLSTRHKDGGMLETVKTDTNPDEIIPTQNACGHLNRYAPYCDSNACFICDKNMIAGEY